MKHGWGDLLVRSAYSPLARQERPAEAKPRPGEGEKKRQLATYFPLPLTLSRQGRGEKALLQSAKLLQTQTVNGNAGFCP